MSFDFRDYTVNMKGEKLLQFIYNGSHLDINKNGATTLYNDELGLNFSADTLSAIVDKYEYTLNKFFPHPDKWMDENNMIADEYKFSLLDYLVLKPINLTTSESNPISEDKPKTIKVNEESSQFTATDFYNKVHGVSLDELLATIELKKTLLFTAAPGTGKTTTAIALGNYLVGETNSERMTLVNFSSTTSYSDIIGGMRIVDGKWDIVKGSLAKLAEKACNDKEHKYVYLVDELNRCHGTSALGEFMTCIEARGKSILTNVGFELEIPSNLYIIATMNLLDQSTVRLDDAFLSRFAIYTMPLIGTEDISKINPDANETLANGLRRTIKTLKDVNEFLAKVKVNDVDNELGTRFLYDNYNNINDLIIGVQFGFKPLVKNKCRNLSKQNSDTLIKKIDELLVDLKHIKNNEPLEEDGDAEEK